MMPSQITLLGLFILASSLLLKEVSCDERLDQIMDLSLRKPVTKMNSEKFNKFVNVKDRNYDVIVMLTALNPQRSCHICRQAYDEFVVTAQSFKMTPHHESRKLFFAFVDYDEGSDVFNTLNINSAPGFYYFAEKGNPKSPEELNIQRLGFSADVIGRWIYDKTGMSFKIVRPPNFSGPILVGILTIVLLSILYAGRHSLSVILNRNTVAVTAVMIVLFMTSGQMWNHIRGAPFMQRNNKGQVNYIHNSSNGQFVVETYLVMILSGGIALGMILATEAMRANSRIDGKRKNFFAVLGLALMVLFYSLLLATFRRKSYGYPYRLLF